MEVSEECWKEIQRAYDRAIELSIQSEREACAKIAANHAEANAYLWGGPMARSIEEAILKRNEP